MSGTGKLLIASGIAVLILPFMLIARNREETSPLPRYMWFTGMELQSKVLPQQPSRLFRDGRAMRPHVPGTVAREDMVSAHVGHGLRIARLGNFFGPTLAGRHKQQEILRGQVKNKKGKPHWLQAIPIRLNMRFLRRGRRQFDTYCAPCHGYSGYGDGMVAQVAAMLQVEGAKGVTTWVQPSSLHTHHVRKKPPGEIFDIITHGIRRMPRYDSQIDVMDRWAIVAYVEALQHSQDVPLKKLNAAQRRAFYAALRKAHQPLALHPGGT